MKDQIPQLNESQRLQLLRKVTSLVRKKHFNPAFAGMDWFALAEEQTPAILQSKTPLEFEELMQRLVSELKTSHTGFAHRSFRRMPAKQAINATFMRCETGLGIRWIFQDVHPGGPADKAGIEPGDILIKIGDHEIVPPEQPVFRMNSEVIATVLKGNQSSKEVQFDIPSPKFLKPPIGEPDIVNHRLLGDGIGYIKITMFPGIVGIDVANDIDKAVAELKNCQRMIIDLRGNVGGGIGGLRLMSYLTPGKMPVGYSLTRARAENGYKREELVQFDKIPSRKRSLFSLAFRYAFVDKSIAVVTEGLGAQPFHERVVILVNEHSASASEMIAAFAVENRLATIIGTKTPGRLLTGSTFRLGHGFYLGLPTASYLTWKGNLIEGRGITPDIVVENQYEFLKTGKDCQLEAAIEKVKTF